jgi:hypothetical protein
MKLGRSRSESESGGLDLRIWIHTKMLWIRNTARGYNIFLDACEKNVSIESEKLYNTSVL